MMLRVLDENQNVSPDARNGRNAARVWLKQQWPTVRPNWPKSSCAFLCFFCVCVCACACALPSVTERSKKTPRDGFFLAGPRCLRQRRGCRGRPPTWTLWQVEVPNVPEQRRHLLQPKAVQGWILWRHPSAQILHPIRQGAVLSRKMGRVQFLHARSVLPKWEEMHLGRKRLSMRTVAVKCTFGTKERCTKTTKIVWGKRKIGQKKTSRRGEQKARPRMRWPKRLRINIYCNRARNK